MKHWSFVVNLVASRFEYFFLWSVLINFGQRKFGAYVPYASKWSTVVTSSVSSEREWVRILEVPHNSFSLQTWYVVVFTTLTGKLWDSISK
jgi:hypothetical protein